MLWSFCSICHDGNDDTSTTIKSTPLKLNGPKKGVTLEVETSPESKPAPPLPVSPQKGKPPLLPSSPVLQSRKPLPLPLPKVTSTPQQSTPPSTPPPKTRSTPQQGTPPSTPSTDVSCKSLLLEDSGSEAAPEVGTSISNASDSDQAPAAASDAASAPEQQPEPDCSGGDACKPKGELLDKAEDPKPSRQASKSRSKRSKELAPEKSNVEQRPRVCSKGLPTGELQGLVSISGAPFEGGDHELCLLGISRPRSRTSSDCSQAVVEPDCEEKTVEHSGADSEDAMRSRLEAEGIAVSCRKGRKPERPNQDNFFVCRSGVFTICCVADGHGKDGHWSSHWAARFALRLLLEDISTTRALPADDEVWKIFDKVHKELASTAQTQSFDLMLSGCTMSIVVVDREQRQLLASWVGDSSCVLGRVSASAAPRHSERKSARAERKSSKAERVAVECVCKTSDHKPRDDQEYARITSRGGEVVHLKNHVCPRIFARGMHMPGLAMSRAIGDVAAHNIGLVHVPGFLRTAFQPDDVLLLCSDGVWDFVDSTEALDVIIKAGRKDVGKAVQDLVSKARDRWLQETRAGSTDDITAIALWL